VGAGLNGLSHDGRGYAMHPSSGELDDAAAAQNHSRQLRWTKSLWAPLGDPPWQTISLLSTLGASSRPSSAVRRRRNVRYVC
jgi:hypothetical protein